MRIPTLLALALIILVIAGVSAFFFYQQNLVGNSNLIPVNIGVSNITDQSATITWQTKNPTTGQVAWGESNSLGNNQNDDRDKTNLQTHITHFVTLNSLNENTTYYFQVLSNSLSYPNKSLSFKTAKTTTVTSDLKDFNKPLIGVILSPNLEPVDEAIVTLDLKGASPLSTLTTTAGNFIIPLLDLKNQDLSASLSLDQPIEGLLIAQRGDQRSEVKIVLPMSSQILTKIVLGQNSDLTHIGSSSATPLIPSPTNAQSK